MLKEFLRSNYAQKIVQRSKINLTNWSVDSNSVTRNFKFVSYSNAVEFQQITADFLTNSKLNFSINNVYNGVTVVVNNELTQNDVDVLSQLNRLFTMMSDNLFSRYLNCPMKGKCLPERLNPSPNNQEVRTSYKLNSNDFFKGKNLLH